MTGFAVAAMLPPVDKFSFFQSRISPPLSALEIVMAREAAMAKAAAAVPPLCPADLLGEKMAAVANSPAMRMAWFFSRPAPEMPEPMAKGAVV